MAADRYRLPGGATRSGRAPAYHLVPPDGLQRTAQRFALGAERHGAWNWQQSLDTEAHAYLFCCEAYNHLVDHLFKMVTDQDQHDDHLGAIGWAQTVLAYAEARFKKPWTQFDGHSR